MYLKPNANFLARVERLGIEKERDAAAAEEVSNEYAPLLRMSICADVLLGTRRGKARRRLMLRTRPS